ncbi:MAG: protein kinase domain-containing protein, partial [Solirubrobacteraceae bacterium]
EKKIGSGGMAMVFLARDERLQRHVALKVLTPTLASDESFRLRFVQESRAAAAVDDPHIIPVFEAGEAGGVLYIAMRYVAGGDVQGLLKRERQLPVAQVAAIVSSVASALDSAHAAGLVHRDVKPANILLSPDGRVKVGDFGVARLAEGSTDGTAASIVGTPRYMAPEQARGRPTTPATDVYSAGVVLYEMLAGHPPFSSESVVELALRHLQEAPPPLPVRLPGSLVSIVERALAKDPAQRYADGAEMAEALRDARRRAANGRRERVAASATRESAPETHRTLIAAGAAGPRTPGRLWSGPTGPPNVPVPGPPSRFTRPPAPPRPGPHGTRRAPQRSPRRNVNPAGRRRAAAARGVVIALLAAMVTAAVVIGRTAHTHIPNLMHQRQDRAVAAARRAHVRAKLSKRYARAPAGVVIAEHPAAGTPVPDGAIVHLTLSKGPAPVPVISARNLALGDAERLLHNLGLRTAVREVPAPGAKPGTVVGQDPARGSRPRGSVVTLSVAEVPRWRPVTTFTGRSSGAFHITGRRWRIVYRMAFRGTCTWVVFCSGPAARVTGVTGRYIAGFGLNDADAQVQTFATGPGSYEVQVIPGADDAGWSLQVQDDY